MSGEWQFTDFYDISTACPTCGWTYTCQGHAKETPTLKQFTDITILLDRSGSMESIRSAMEEAFNALVAEHRVNPTTKFSLIQFDTANSQEVVYQSVPVGAVEKLTLVPRGGTPLLDALSTAIDSTGRRYSSMQENERPDQVLFIIITDGQENSSKHTTRSQVFDKVTKQNSDYKWQFIYLGANQDAIAEAASFGIGQNWAMNYTATKSGVLGSTRSLMVNTVAYANSAGNARGGAAASFTPEQREAAVDSATTTVDLTTAENRAKYFQPDDLDFSKLTKGKK